MKKPVLITVSSEIGSVAGEPDKMSFVTEGTLDRVNNEYIVSYEESEITGLKGTTTILKVNGDSITLIRQGNVESIMLFEKGKTHLTNYDTQFGSVMLGITAKNVHVDFCDKGGNIKVDYILEYNRLFGGRNSINISVSEARN